MLPNTLEYFAVHNVLIVVSRQEGANEKIKIELKFDALNISFKSNSISDGTNTERISMGFWHVLVNFEAWSVDLDFFNNTEEKFFIE